MGLVAVLDPRIQAIKGTNQVIKVIQLGHGTSILISDQNINGSSV